MRLSAGYVDELNLIDPNLSYTWTACGQEMYEDPEAKSAIEKHSKVFQIIVSSSKRILAFVWSSTGGHGIEHWTLMVAEQSGPTTAMKYYDTLEV